MFYLDNSGYTQNHYDALDRVTAVDIAGDKWRKAGKQNRTEFLANTDADYVCIYKANSTPSSTGRYYPAGSLTKEIAKDADNKTVITFKDLSGNVILQRANDGTNNLDTYYVYDEIGRLRYVLTPQCQKAGISAVNYYEYSYDYRGRVKTKKLPGCKAVEYWYDKADRVAYMKDPALGSRYRFYLYDKLGRLCVQGTCTDGTRDSTKLSTTSYVSGTDNGICKTGYTAPYTIKDPKLEIVNYYDNYNFKDKQQKSNMPAVTVSSTQKRYSIGSLTGTVVYATNGEALGTVNVYDQKAQVVRSLRKGLGGYVEDVKNVYTFTGAIDTTTATVNVKYGSDFVAMTNYTYGYGVKKKMKLSVAHGSSATARETEYKYDLIGRLQSKSRDLYNSYKSTCSYTYDVHGWLTSINSGGFQEYLYYAETGGIDDTKYYNGNISAYKWKNRDESDFKGYIFKYDDNNRLREAVYGQGNNLASYKNYYSEYVDEYDRNGNILRLKRRGLTDKMHGGFGNVDDLYMSYSGNKLTSVRDEASRHPYEGATDFDGVKGKEYTLKYNNAGSLVSDAGRNIAKIQYDSNNNPTRIQFTNGNVTKYVYSATGEKLRVIYQTSVYPENAEIVEIGKTKELTKEEEKCTETVDYLLGGALTMRNGRIDKYQFEEGYCQARKAGDKDYFTFCYYDQDHLGNIRQVTQDYNGMSKGKVIQTMNYYPFGAEFCDNGTKSYVQNHKYNGKEFDNMHGLNTYDYGARQYNPVTGRWDRMDPHSESYYNVSPYAYCHNNPVMLVDPNGMDDYFNDKGEFIKRTDTGSAVMVMCGDQFKNITEVNFSDNINAVQNIGRHYLAKSDKSEFNLTVSSIGGNIPTDAVFSNDAGTQNYDIYLSDGFVNPALGNCYDFECITFHESTHRYDSSTHGGTIGEARAITRTATECPAWNLASDNYIQAQASYAAQSLNKYSNSNTIPQNVVQNLNNAFMGYAAFEFNNNHVSVANNLKECVVIGKDPHK